MGFASDPNVKLTHRDVAFFGATADGTTILDSYISVSATGSVLTAVSDADAEKLSFDLSQRIQNELTYPGQVKVTVIREMRAVNYAK